MLIERIYFNNLFTNILYFIIENVQKLKNINFYEKNVLRINYVNII